MRQVRVWAAPQFVCFHPIYYLSLSFPSSLPSRTSDPGGGTEQALLPPSTTVHAWHFLCRDKASAFSSLVDSRPIVLSTLFIRRRSRKLGSTIGREKSVEEPLLGSSSVEQPRLGSSCVEKPHWAVLQLWSPYWAVLPLRTPYWAVPPLGSPLLGSSSVEEPLSGSSSVQEQKCVGPKSPRKVPLPQHGSRTRASMRMRQ